MGPLGDKMQKKIFGKSGDLDKKFYKTFLVFAFGIILMMIITGLITFFVTLKGKEQTMVPDVTGLKLENALVELEEKALYPSLQLKFTQNFKDKGLVVEQDPASGTNVKEGSRVILKVSKGSAVETLEDYIGWNINDLEAHLKSLVSIYGPLLSIKKPLVKVYDDSPAGTILVQKPESGTDISAATELELVISKGQIGQTRTVFKYTDLSFKEALEHASNENIRFVFTTKKVSNDIKSGIIISQSPAAGTEVPTDTVMQLVIADYEKTPEDDFVFGVLEKTLPDYQVPITLKVDAITPDGSVKQLFTMKHSGGVLTIPYREKENTIIKIIVAEKEILTYSVKASRNG